MKKFFALLLAMMMLALTFTVLAEETIPEARTLIMATNAQFPPYEFYGDDGEITGIDVEIAKAIADYLGYGFQVDDMEFDSIITAVAPTLSNVEPKADFGMAGMTVTEDRLQSVSFSDSYATGVQVIIVPEKSPITSVDDLFAEGAYNLVGVQLSTTGDIYATEDIQDAGFGEVREYPSGNDAVMALVSGKIDCVIIDNEPAKAYVAANPGLKILETEYVTEHYAACFKKDNTELLAQFNEALKALTEDGTIPSIIEKYIPSEVAEDAE